MIRASVATQVQARRSAWLGKALAGVALSLGCAAAMAAPTGEGLDSLDDHALATELSSRGLSTLLDRYFTTRNTPESERQAIQTFGALKELANTKVPPAQRARVVKAAAQGIDVVLPTLHNPAQMMETADQLTENGILRNAENMEYWGEDPATQADLLPVASAVLKLQDAAKAVAQSQADELAKKITGPNDPNAAKWTELDQLSQGAAYNRAMSVYYKCIALPAKDPERRKLADSAILELTNYDTPDSGVQALIRNRIGKLHLAGGESKEARAMLQSVYVPAKNVADQVKPDPNPFQIYEARYFVVATDLESGDLKSAIADKAELDEWQTKAMPGLLQAAGLKAETIATSTKSMLATGQMLAWRIHVLEGDLAKTPADKAKADAAAETVLLDLRKSQPNLAPIIDEQLVKRMPADKKIDNTTAVSLLLALLKKGVTETYKPDAENPNRVMMTKGIEAARLLIAKKGQPDVTVATVDEASLSIPLLQERLGKNVDAGNSYLDYAANFYPTNPAKANDALNRAGYLIFQMKKAPPTPEGFADFYNRFQPMAILPPFNHVELAYKYAEQLRDLSNFKEAIKFYRLIPKTQPAYSVAQYKIMLVLADMRNTKLDPAERQQIIGELMTTAGEVKRLGAGSTEPIARAKAAQASIMLAELSRTEQKKPDEALAALSGFDAIVKGVPGEADLVTGALRERIYDYMALGKTNDAVGQLTLFLQNSKGDEGISLVSRLLDQLDKEFARAQIAHDAETMRVTARNQASLTSHLKEWAGANPQPKIKKLYYAYAVYDARTQRIAGSLAVDPTERKKLLQQASAQYRALLSSDMHALYIAQDNVKAQIDAGKVDPTDPDPSVATGLAFTDFDLGNFKSALEQLEPMIALKRFGTPRSETVDPVTKEPKLVDNDLYWEAQYKFIKSDYEVSKNDPAALEIVRKILKNLLILGGVPDRYTDDFEGLRKTLIPDFVPGKRAEPSTRPIAQK